MIMVSNQEGYGEGRQPEKSTACGQQAVNSKVTIFFGEKLQNTVWKIVPIQVVITYAESILYL